MRALEAPALQVPTLLEKGLEAPFGMEVRKSSRQQAGPAELVVAGGQSSIFPPESTFLGFPDSGIPPKLSPLGKGVWGEPVFCYGSFFLLLLFAFLKGISCFLFWQQMEEIWREMRWIMDALQHARYKQPSCGVSLGGFLSEAGGAMKEKTRSTSSHLDYLPSPAPSPETSRKLNSGKDPALQSSCLVGSGGCRDRCSGLAAPWGCRQGQRRGYRQGSRSRLGQDLLCPCLGERSTGVR